MRRMLDVVTAVVSPLAGEVPSAILEGASGSGGNLVRMMETLRADTTALLAAGTHPWAAPPAFRRRAELLNAAWVGQTLIDICVQVDAQAGGRFTQHHMKRIILDQGVRWLQFTRSWRQLGAGADSAPDMVVDASVPAYLPEWLEAEPRCPWQHMITILAAMVELQNWIEGLMADFDKVPVPARLQGRAQLVRQEFGTACDAAAAARSLAFLTGTDDVLDRPRAIQYLRDHELDPAHHESVEQDAIRAIEGFLALAQWFFDPDLPGQFPAVPDERRTAGFDAWSIATEYARESLRDYHGFDPDRRGDAEDARRAMDELSEALSSADYSVQYARLMAIHHRIQQLLEQKVLVATSTWNCCPYYPTLGLGPEATSHRIDICGEQVNLSRGRELTVLISDETEFEPQIKVGEFSPTTEWESC